MFHPFKKAEAAWNARTPVWMHNKTKENIIAQLIAAVVLLVSYCIYDEYKERKTAAARRRKLNIEEHIVKIR